MQTSWKIIAARSSARQYLRDLVEYREFFLFLFWRDLLVRYKQTVFGVGWAILRPLLNLVVFASVFGVFARFPSAGAPYPVFALLGILPWQVVSSSMLDTSNALVAQATLLTKVYFPRMYLPASLVLIQGVDFLIGLAFFLPFVIWSGGVTLSALYFLPLLLGWTLFLSWGIGLWLSAYSLLYRDFRILTPFVVQVGMLLSPVAYSTEMVPAQFFPWYALNPVVGIIDAFRWVFLGAVPPQAPLSLVVSGVGTALIAVSGFFVFLRKEAVFADVG